MEGVEGVDFEALAPLIADEVAVEWRVPDPVLEFTTSLELS